VAGVVVELAVAADPAAPEERRVAGDPLERVVVEEHEPRDLRARRARRDLQPIEGAAEDARVGRAQIGEELLAVAALDVAQTVAGEKMAGAILVAQHQQRVPPAAAAVELAHHRAELGLADARLQRAGVLLVDEDAPVAAAGVLARRAEAAKPRQVARREEREPAHGVSATAAITLSRSSLE